LTHPWSFIRDMQGLKNAVEAEIPLYSTVDEVRSRLHRHGLTCSNLTDGVIYCSIKRRSLWMFIKRLWLLEFHFVDGRLVRVDVKEGATGP